MEKLIITNSNVKEITFEEFPNMDVLNDIKNIFPNLRSVIFNGCVIKDFSLMEIFKDYDISFVDTIIEDYSYPINLNLSSIYFENTRMNFEKFFFMTSMSNLKIITLFYDSLEGVNLFKPYFHLLKMFPLIERIRLWMDTDETYYDLAHTKVMEKGNWSVGNLGVLLEAKLGENMDFINYLPCFFPKTFDGIHQIYNMDFNLWKINRLFWVNPKYKTYYDSKFKCENFIKIREELLKIKKYGPMIKEVLGREKREINYDINPIYTYYDLKKGITNVLRTTRLKANTTLENNEPDISLIYGLFGERLYNAKGHLIIVNERGSIISDQSINLYTKRLENNLLPF